MKLERSEHIVGFLLKSLQHTLRQRMDEAMRTHGIELSFAHFAALFGLYSEPGSNGAKLARRAFVSAQTMNSVLRRLEDDGHIERRPHPDSRRADSWFLTDEGLEQLERARKVGQRVFDRMLGSLDATELERLESYLKRCNTALEERGTEPGADVADAPAARRRPKAAARKISHLTRV
jgi:DNA-binding MarR family transcriptional regulator